MWTVLLIYYDSFAFEARFGNWKALLKPLTKGAPPSLLNRDHKLIKIKKGAYLEENFPGNFSIT
jgi:hypothetical protein